MAPVTTCLHPSSSTDLWRGRREKPSRRRPVPSRPWRRYHQDRWARDVFDTARGPPPPRVGWCASTARAPSRGGDRQRRMRCIWEDIPIPRVGWLRARGRRRRRAARICMNVPPRRSPIDPSEMLPSREAWAAEGRRTTRLHLRLQSREDHLRDHHPDHLDQRQLAEDDGDQPCRKDVMTTTTTRWRWRRPWSNMPLLPREIRGVHPRWTPPSTPRIPWRRCDAQPVL